MEQEMMMEKEARRRRTGRGGACSSSGRSGGASRRNTGGGRGRRLGRGPQDFYGAVGGGNLENRPAFDTTPFDSSCGSAWDTLPTTSIFATDECPEPSSTNWLSSPYQEDSRRCPPSNQSRARQGCVTDSGRSSGPSLQRFLSNRRAPSTRPSAAYTRPAESPRSAVCSEPLTGPPSLGQNDDDYLYDFGAFLNQPPRNKPIVVNEFAPPWKPCYASERLEDPNNPPPMFHPLLSNEWRTDPNLSRDLHDLYTSSCSEFSPNFCIFDYGRLSEYNTQNVYDPERFIGRNDEGGYTPAPRADDCEEVFRDPYEALALPTDDIADKFRKEKWRYFEVKKRIELFKKLGMEEDLKLYKGQLERMEADPWTGDDSGEEVHVYVRGKEGDPYLAAAYDDDLLRRMEELTAPTSESLQAFYAAMANPPPPRDEGFKCQELFEKLQRRGRPKEEVFSAASAFAAVPSTSPYDGAVAGPSGSNRMEVAQTCFADEKPRPRRPHLNTSFTLPEGPSKPFPEGIGPDDC